MTALAEPIAVYVHWPYCVKKCPYCDFNSHVRPVHEAERWCRAVLAELDHFAGWTEGKMVGSIFFGGGTPSLMPPDATRRVIEHVAERWPLSRDIEITLEANPNSVEAGRFRDFRAAGVNRVSIGVQSLDDAALRFLGRAHSANEARQAIEIAARTFERYSFDLIYARPGQTEADWERELAEALSLASGHLSLYQLTIEPGTAFHGAYARAEFSLPDDELGGALYELTQSRLEASGLPAYEISNHARPSEESRHNLAYWHYDDYVGVGPGAHGRLTQAGKKHAIRQVRSPEIWLQQVETSGHGTEAVETLDPVMLAEEFLMMGLRLTAGISRQNFTRVLGLEPSDLFARDRLDELIDAGFLSLDSERLAATASGRQRLNAVLARLTFDPRVFAC